MPSKSKQSKQHSEVMMRRALKFFLLLIVLLGMMVAGGAYYAFRTTTNPHPATVTLQALDGSVTVHWDDHGVPHIKARASDRDAAFALGYVHALDRFWQMDYQRHIVSGRLSELFGKQTLAQDKFLRTFGFYRAAQQAYPKLSEQTHRFVSAYTLGVNKFLSRGNLSLPFLLLRHLPYQWTEVDSVAWLKMMAFDLATSWEEKTKNALLAKRFSKKVIPIFLPPYPQDAPTILSDDDLKATELWDPKLPSKPITQRLSGSTVAALRDLAHQTDTLRKRLNLPASPGKGSNSWVVSGRLTASGHTYLANDPHLELSAPVIWYQVELQGPTLHVTGASIPGLPGVVIGHNDQLAWGVTASYADEQELYLEPRSAKLQQREETIYIKDAQPVKLTITTAPHGPVISDISRLGAIDPMISLRWAALEDTDKSPEAMLHMMYATNWQDFNRALADFVSPSLNFVYADTRGNIGYHLVGKIPRRIGYTGYLPVASDGQHEWQGFIPYSKLPHIYNPESGLIFTANNKPVSNHYPGLLSFRHPAPPYRAIRLRELFNTRRKLTLNDMRGIQQDVVSSWWPEIKEPLLSTTPLDELSKLGLARLRDWDGRFTLDSEAASIFTYWQNEFAQRLPEEMRQGSYWYSPLFIKKQIRGNTLFCKVNNRTDCANFLSVTLRQAMKKLVREHSAVPQAWAWGKVHQARFIFDGLGKSPYFSWLFNREIAAVGSQYTVNNGSFNFPDFHMTAGSLYRQIIDVSDFQQSLYAQALGQSDNLFSPHYADLLKPWRNGEYWSIEQASNE